MSFSKILVQNSGLPYIRKLIKVSMEEVLGENVKCARYDT